MLQFKTMEEILKEEHDEWERAMSMEKAPNQAATKKLDALENHIEEIQRLGDSLDTMALMQKELGGILGEEEKAQRSGGVKRKYHEVGEKGRDEAAQLSEKYEK